MGFLKKIIMADVDFYKTYLSVFEKYDMEKIVEISNIFVMNIKQLQKELYIIEIMYTVLESIATTLIVSYTTEKDNCVKADIMIEHSEVSCTKSYINSVKHLLMTELFTQLGLMDDEDE